MNKFLKGLLGVFLSVALLATVFATYKTINPPEVIFSGLKVSTMFWANSGGNILADNLKDFALNPYLTGTLTPGRSVSGNTATTGMVLGTTNNYKLQLIVSGINAGWIDSSSPPANTFYGYQAGNAVTLGEFNVGIGYLALKGVSAGNRNTCMGGFCLQNVTLGTDNTCMGIYCTQKTSTGSYNSSIGDESLQYNIGGSFNTALGMSAGNTPEYGDMNTYIGYGSNTSGNITVDHSTAIGAVAKIWTGHMMQLGATDLTRLTTRANMGIGLLDPTEALEVSGTIIAKDYIKPGKIYHMYGGFQQNLTTVTITGTNIWTWVTNAGHNLWTGLEFDGLTMSGDIMIITNTGDYAGNVSLSLAGGSNTDYFIRVWNITQGVQMGYIIGGTTTSINNFTPIALPVYIEANAGDNLRLEIQNITNTDDPNVRSAVFYLSYLHNGF